MVDVKIPFKDYFDENRLSRKSLKGLKVYDEHDEVYYIHSVEHPNRTDAPDVVFVSREESINSGVSKKTSDLYFDGAVEEKKETKYVMKKIMTFESFVSEEAGEKLPTPAELKKMFDKINADIKKDDEKNKTPDDESVYVPLTDAEYYATQIQNIYNVDDDTADKLAADMAKLVKESINESSDKLNMSKDQHLMSIRTGGKEMGHIELKEGKIVTSGQIGENEYDNFVELIRGLQGFDIKVDDFFF